MFTSEELLSKINRYIAEMQYERRPQTLYSPIKYAMSSGGKRFRPVLMLLSYNLFHNDVESILTQACALEMYHNYTLLHDDLMDNADVRRGKATVYRKWDANTAILSGDTMFAMACHNMAKCNKDKVQEIMDLFTTTTLEIGEGQQYDLDFEKRNDVNEDEYMEMIRLKTAVLPACAAKIGAILGGAEMTQSNNLYRFGEQIGLAFQLQDDMLDIYADQKTFGKTPGGDIVCNKKTWFLINATTLSDNRQRNILDSWIIKKDANREEKIATITAIFNELDLKKKCERRINQLYKQSLLNLDSLDALGLNTTEIRHFATNLMQRNY